MALTRTWNAAYEALPADTDPVSEGANRIRDLKTDIQERGEVDHSWAGDADDGKHKRVLFVDPLGTKPTLGASEGALYTKDVSSKAELFYEDEDGDEIQLTNGGELNAIPAGTDMLFYATSAPTGWTQNTSANLNDVGLRIVNDGTGSLTVSGTEDWTSGLTTTDGHQLTIAEMPAHTHTYDKSDNAGHVGAGVGISARNPTSTVSGSTGGDGSHAHAITFAPKYVDFIVCTRDSYS